MTTLKNLLKQIKKEGEKEMEKEVNEKVTTEEKEVESVIITRHYRWNNFYKAEEFRDIVLKNMEQDSSNLESISNTFIEEKFNSSVKRRIFKAIMEEDFDRFQETLDEIISNTETPVSKADFWKIIALYAFLKKSEFIPETEMTKTIEIGLTEDYRPKLPNDFREKAGEIFNTVVIIISEFFNSVSNGFLSKLVKENVNDISEAELEYGVFSAELLLYTLMISVFENKYLKDTISTSKNKSKQFPGLYKDGKIKERKIETFEQHHEMEKDVQDTVVNPDLSGLSTSNRQKDTTSEFLNNESVDDVPVLEVAK